MSIRLEPHNVETYKKVTDKLKGSNKVAVIQPTGTGKMYIALKLLEENKEKKAIYVAPSNPILHDVKKNIFAEGMTMSDFPNLKRITYQKLARLTDQEIQELDADIIILDEFHHCGAPEWGKGVERLLQINEGASVLGLSATPLRYTDGLRDMADELFENNVASEMTLEEAIESEILPEASYVSTLYGYNKELEGMQTNIDKIKDEEKRKEAQDLLNNLRDKLDENTQNLPELFSEHMQEKSGKYIVFCRNIEDMNEKMEQAQKMFGGVNSNITIRGISSKIKESDKILTEFEQDSEEGTLKLLYAVDMLNEGYHIKDLDGVIMMRPTFSPTIYTQQLGRALTVGGDKSPIVLDLVNNFDSCKIIEDFAEKMKKYKGNDQTGRKENSKKSRLSIFDTTKEFREIAEKITELSKRSKVKLDQKIEIFEEFMKTGEELVGNTTFRGYPIGQWAIQIRNILNRMNDGKDDKVKINPTKEQLKKLESMGILERQIDSTIDEKIDSLVEWRRRYPKIKMIPIATDEELREYARTDEEFSKIQEEYEKIQRYYYYVRNRKYQGKLNEKQIEKCKEGEVGGVFGYSTRIEELSKKYGIKEKEIDYLLTKFGTLDNFYEMHNTGKIEGDMDKTLEERIIRSVVDIDGNSNIGYDNLCRAILGIKTKEKGVFFYSSKELQKALEEQRLTEREKYVIESIYGLNEGKTPTTYSSLGREIGVTAFRISQIHAKACRKLRFLDSKNGIIFKIEGDEYLTDKERQQIEEIKKNIQLQNGDLHENLRKLKEIQEQLRTIKNKKNEEKKTITEKKKEANKEKELDVADLGLSIRAYNCLKRARIDYLGDFANITEERFRKTRNLGEKSFEEIVAKMQEFGISFKAEEQLENDRIEKKEETQQELRKTREKSFEKQYKEENRPKTELEIELEKKFIELFGEDNALQEGTEKIDDIRVETEKDETEISSENKVKTEEPITANDEQKKKEINLEDMTPEQLQKMIDENQRIIENNERQIKKDTEKSKLIQRLLEQQQTIDAQQEEINRLRKLLESPQQ